MKSFAVAVFVVVVVVVVGVCVVQVTGEATFSCEGRASGYYADVDTGCQVYHMCDGLGRQFSYSCPNTTLFQQRMLICDHWYMVNCSRSILDYEANLLIGQRDKPFVEDSSERPYQRTPRPDLLTEPYAPLHQDTDAYRRAKSHGVTAQNLVGVVTDEEDYKGDGDTDEPQYLLPSHWSLEYARSGDSAGRSIDQKSSGNSFNQEQVSEEELNSKAQYFKVEKSGSSTANKPVADKKLRTVTPSFQPPVTSSSVTKNRQTVSSDSTSLLPSLIVGTLPNFNRQFIKKQQLNLPIPTTNSPISSTLPSFPPSPFIIQTNIPTSTPRQTFTSSIPKETTQFVVTSTTRTSSPVEPTKSHDSNQEQLPIDVAPPSIYYQPPKLIPSMNTESTTMDPQTFYRLVPSKDLQPPKLSQRSERPDRPVLTTTTARAVTKKETASALALPETGDTVSSDKRWMELRKMFFIPEYDFPLEAGPRPGYEGGISSFQVNGASSDEASTSRDASKTAVNTECPKCDLAFVVPGTCKPCVMIRR